MTRTIQKNKNLFSEIKTLIEQSKQQVAIAVNSTMTMLYWQIGKRINEGVLQDKRRLSRAFVTTICFFIK